LELRDEGTDMRMQLYTAEDAELEVWATHRHLQPFERLVGKPVRIEVVKPAATVAAAPSRRPPRREASS
jgi:hypothetical protein